MSRRDELAARLERSSRALIAGAVMVSDRIAERVGLPVADQQALHVLTLAGRPMTAGELGAACNLPSSTTTRLIDRLEKQGFVRRQYSESDRRKILVVAQPARLAVLEQAYAEMRDRNNTVNSHFTVDELEVVARYMDNLLEAGLGVPTP